MKFNAGKGYNVVYSSRENSGTIVIKEYTSTTVKGTFNFDVYYTSLGVTDTVKITNGDFCKLYRPIVKFLEL